MLQTSPSKPTTSNNFEVLAHQTDLSLDSPTPPETELMKYNPSKQADTTTPHADPWVKGASSSDKQKEPVWNTQVMEMNVLESNASLEEEPNEELNYPQIMEEET